MLYSKYHSNYYENKDKTDGKDEGLPKRNKTKNTTRGRKAKQTIDKAPVKSHDNTELLSTDKS